MKWLKGKKTFIVSALLVGVALLNMVTGEMGLMEFLSSPHLSTLLEGIGLGTLRAGVSKLL